MNSYRNLASQKIADTLTTLAQRIGERFPGSGLLKVCRELIVMAEQTSERADKIANMQRLIDEGLASGVSERTPGELLEEARRRARATRGL